MLRKVLLLCFLLCAGNVVFAANREYRLWYNRPAFNKGGDCSVIKAYGYPFDEDWERWSLPIGNGYMEAIIMQKNTREICA